MGLLVFSVESSKTLYVISRLMTSASLSPTCTTFWNSRYVYLIAHLTFLPRFLVAISTLEVKRQILTPSLLLFHDLFLQPLLPNLISADDLRLPMLKSSCDPSLLSLFLSYLVNPWEACSTFPWNVSQIHLLPLHLQFSLVRSPLSQAPAVTSLNVSLLPTHTAATASSQIAIRWRCSPLKTHQRVPARFSLNLNCLVWIIKLNMIWPLSSSLISSHTPALSLSSLQPYGYARYLTHQAHYHNRASAHCSSAPPAIPADGHVASSSCHHDLLRQSSEHLIFYLFILTLWNL